MNTKVNYLFLALISISVPSTCFSATKEYSIKKNPQSREKSSTPNKKTSAKTQAVSTLFGFEINRGKVIPAAVATGVFLAAMALGKSVDEVTETTLVGHIVNDTIDFSKPTLEDYGAKSAIGLGLWKIIAGAGAGAVAVAVALYKMLSSAETLDFEKDSLRNPKDRNSSQAESGPPLLKNKTNEEPLGNPTDTEVPSTVVSSSQNPLGPQPQLKGSVGIANDSYYFFITSADKKNPAHRTQLAMALYDNDFCDNHRCYSSEYRARIYNAYVQSDYAKNNSRSHLNASVNSLLDSCCPQAIPQAALDQITSVNPENPGAALAFSRFVVTKAMEHVLGMKDRSN
jgi:hypothetical protein